MKMGASIKASKDAGFKANSSILGASLQCQQILTFPQPSSERSTGIDAGD